jgi:hypothetical protein
MIDTTESLPNESFEGKVADIDIHWSNVSRKHLKDTFGDDLTIKSLSEAVAIHYAKECDDNKIRVLYDNLEHIYITG